MNYWDEKAERMVEEMKEHHERFEEDDDEMEDVSESASPRVDMSSTGATKELKYHPKGHKKG